MEDTVFGSDFLKSSGIVEYGFTYGAAADTMWERPTPPIKKVRVLVPAWILGRVILGAGVSFPVP